MICPFVVLHGRNYWSDGFDITVESLLSHTPSVDTPGYDLPESMSLWNVPRKFIKNYEKSMKKNIVLLTYARSKKSVIFESTLSC